jgi:hypothetical protein
MTFEHLCFPFISARASAASRYSFGQRTFAAQVPPFVEKL